jgi:hypothetical protein
VGRPLPAPKNRYPSLVSGSFASQGKQSACWRSAADGLVRSQKAHPEKHAVNLKILPVANDDLINGYHFYDQQSQGLRVIFSIRYSQDIDSLLIYYGIHQKFFAKYNRLLSKRFPFAVYYTVENQDNIIYAVLDCRSNPAWITGRFEGSGL